MTYKLKYWTQDNTYKILHIILTTCSYLLGAIWNIICQKLEDSDVLCIVCLRLFNTYLIHQSPDFEETANVITVTKKAHSRLSLKAYSVILQKHSQVELWAHSCLQ